MQFLPSCGRIDTAIWMHYLDANKTAGEKAWQQLHKDAGSNSGQHPTKHQLYGHQPLITKTIQVRRTRHAGHCWRSRDELISYVLLWTPTYGRSKAYIQQLCEDTGCGPEDLSEAINDREKWRERVSDIRAGGTTWYIYIYIYIYIHNFFIFFLFYVILIGIFYFLFLMVYQLLWVTSSQSYYWGRQ